MRIHPTDALLYFVIKILNLFDGRDRTLDQLVPENVRTVLIVSSTGLGDTLLSTPAISSIRRRYPAARLVAFLNAKNLELFTNNPDLDLIIPYWGGYRRFLRTVREFRNLKAEVAIILHGNEPQATPYSYLSGAKFIVKVPRSPQYGYVLSNPDNGFPNVQEHHAIDVRLKAASLIGGDTIDKRMRLNVDSEDYAFIEDYLMKQEIKGRHILIGFQTGAAKGYKIWPAANYVELGKKLLAINPDIRLVLTGSPAEARSCDDIAQQIGQKTLSAAGKIPLKHTRALLRRLQLLLTNDTGTMHMAIALGTKTVSMFCPTDYRCYGPIYDLHLHRVIEKEKLCISCISTKCKDPVCMSLISVDEVLQAIQELISV